MKLEIFFLAFLGIFLYDLYYDHIFLNMYKKYKKYGIFIFYSFIAFSFYLMFKKDPNKSYYFMQSIKNLIHYAPIDKDAKELFTPLLQVPNLANLYKSNSPYDNIDPTVSTPQYRRMMNSGYGNKNKRSVSETKKKHIASRQDWKCNNCGIKLPGSFEVDHIQALQDGGSNHIDNLEALCRNCHGEKTAKSFL